MKRVFGAAFTIAATVAVGLSWATVGNAACGKISIAEMNWASAELMANVDKIILEKGYGWALHQNALHHIFQLARIFF